MTSLPSFEELFDFVKHELCQKADLDDSTPMIDVTLYRKGTPCGIEYTLLGPRSLRLSAIWDANEGKILFYDEDLKRFLVEHVEGPKGKEISSRTRSDVRVRSMWSGK